MKNKYTRLKAVFEGFWFWGTEWSSENSMNKWFGFFETYNGAIHTASSKGSKFIFGDNFGGILKPSGFDVIVKTDDGYEEVRNLKKFANELCKWCGGKATFEEYKFEKDYTKPWE